MFQKLVRRIRKSSLLAQSVREISRRQRLRQEHSCLAYKEGDWWLCRTTTAAARELAFRGAVVRVSPSASFYPTRAAASRAGPYRRIPGIL